MHKSLAIHFTYYPFLEIISGLYLSKLTRYKSIQYYKYLLIITILITIVSIKTDFKKF